MTGERFLVRDLTIICTFLFSFPTETMAEHRAKSLSARLSTALATGYSEIEPGLEPLKVRADPLLYSLADYLTK